MNYLTAFIAAITTIVLNALLIFDWFDKHNEHNKPDKADEPQKVDQSDE